MQGLGLQLLDDVSPLKRQAAPLHADPDVSITCRQEVAASDSAKGSNSNSVKTGWASHKGLNGPGAANHGNTAVSRVSADIEGDALKGTRSMGVGETTAAREAILRKVAAPPSHT